MALRISPHKDLTNSSLYNIAYMGCIPAYELYSYKAKTRQPLQKKQKILRKTLLSRGISLRIAGKPGDKTSISLIDELNTWNPFIESFPLNALVNPLNGKFLNFSLLVEKDKSSIKDIVYGVNLGKLRLAGELLDNKDLGRIKASIVWLNWFLKKQTSSKPLSSNLDLLLSDESRDKESYSNFISSFEEGLREKIENISIVISNELLTFLTRLPKSHLERLQRLYQIHNEINSKDNLKGIFPSYAILSERDLDQLIIMEKLHLLGYRNINQLIFLDREITPLVLDQGFVKKIKKI